MKRKKYRYIVRDNYFRDILKVFSNKKDALYFMWHGVHEWCGMCYMEREEIV